jgi:diguanylate cyclase
MPQISTETLLAEWQALIAEPPLASTQHLRQITETHSGELAEYFYSHMLQNAHAASFLDHDQVKARLGKTMQQWVITVFSAASADQLLAAIELQRRIGEIHARIEVPVSLVMRGGRLLKKRLTELLLLPDRAISHEAASLGCALVDLALEIMCFAFSQTHDRNSRAEEAYRLFSVSQNIGAEKERQRAALLDWENQLMFDLATGDNATDLPRLSQSEFGLWFRHKASHAFQGSPESTSILRHLEQIDATLQDIQLRTTGGDLVSRLTLLRQIREQAKTIKFLLDSLFEQASSLEAGRDVLTHLLNRKFLPVVLSKEVNYSRQSGDNFGVLVIDIDHFKRINDQYGHDAGDAVLQQFAALLASYTRGGDYAFRLGGEEFLVVLVDINAEKAFKAAEKLRERIASEALRLPQNQSIHITVSIGLAIHNGHPDYQMLLQEADQALYRAKQGGRNRCVIA